MRVGGASEFLALGEPAIGKRMSLRTMHFISIYYIATGTFGGYGAADGRYYSTIWPKKKKKVSTKALETSNKTPKHLFPT